jgi:hypothetical protein
METKTVWTFMILDTRCALTSCGPSLPTISDYSAVSGNVARKSGSRSYAGGSTVEQSTLIEILSRLPSSNHCCPWSRHIQMNLGGWSSNQSVCSGRVVVVTRSFCGVVEVEKTLRGSLSAHPPIQAPGVKTSLTRRDPHHRPTACISVLLRSACESYQFIVIRITDSNGFR